MAPRMCFTIARRKPSISWTTRPSQPISRGKEFACGEPTIQAHTRFTLKALLNHSCRDFRPEFQLRPPRLSAQLPVRKACWLGFHSYRSERAELCGFSIKEKPP